MRSSGQRSRRARNGLALLAICVLLPGLMGGCPTYRNDLVGVLETATHGVLLGTSDRATIVRTARDSFIDATINLIFDQFRSDETR